MNFSTDLFKRYLLILQLEHYEITRFILWLKSNFISKNSSSKIPLRWTAKAKALYALSYLIFFLISILLYALLPFYYFVLLIILFWLNSYIFLLIATLPLKLGGFLYTQHVKAYIKNKMSKLSDLQTIAITGSAGKTTTKNILYHLLSKKALRTPFSYNTLFGIFKVVFYELNTVYKYFIVEMGAYKKGDIKELCELMPPNISILTTINEQHIERFGALENTIDAKFEILTNLTKSDVGIVNLDNKYIRDNLDKTTARLIGVTLTNTTSARCAQIIKGTYLGVVNGITSFDLKYEHNIYKFQTALLGRHRVVDIVLSIAAATVCGETMDNLIKKVYLLKQVPHRLEYKVEAGINILDDTYSSNVEGFKEGVEILNTFAGKKVLVTPGLVELGAKEKELHEELGFYAAKFCDEIILVGDSARTLSLEHGALRNGFAPVCIKHVSSTVVAQEQLKKILDVGDAVLFENDLPDQYL